jgi:hypothetical protein
MKPRFLKIVSRFCAVLTFAGMVAGNAQPVKPTDDQGPPQHEEVTRGFARLVQHGRILTHPASQPEYTTRPVSYELGTAFQLDRDHCLLLASMREQGGHDFEVGNDGFIFQRLNDIRPERAIAINRLDVNCPLKS